MSRIDYVPYPPTSFPFRDLLVLEQLPLSAADRVCEIGVGSGGTTARLARLCAEVTGFEISAPTVEAVRYLEGRYPNLQFVVADITQATAAKAHGGRFTRLIACDTLEHVDDPAAFFRAAHGLLAPGGEFLVTFPNEPKDKMHGVTRFDDVASLSKVIRDAGLPNHRIGSARLTTKADSVAQALGWKPVELVRTALRRGRRQKFADGSGKKVGEASSGAAAPQTFEGTHFFKRRAMWNRLSPAVNLYWYGVLHLMEARGPAFEIDWDFRHEPFTDCQVVITGRRA